MQSGESDRLSPHLKIRSSRVARDFLVSARRDEEAVVYPLRPSHNEAGRENLSNPMRDTVNLARHIVASPRSASSNPSSSLLVSRKIHQYRGRRYFEMGAIDVKKIVVGGSICVIAIMLAGFFLHLLSPVGRESGERQISFEVKPGDGYKDIISNLGSKGLIRSRSAFTLLSLVTGSAMNLKPGLYSLKSGMTSGEILSKLVSGSRTEISVTVVEGYSVYDIDRLLSSLGVLKAGELVEANKKNFFEGRLFPDTYRFFKDSDVDQVVGKFLDTFASKTDQIFAGNDINSTSSPSGLNPQAVQGTSAPSFSEELLNSPQARRDERLILASLIEKEIPDFEDRKIVAGILLKRVKAGIPIQVDATICYVKEVAIYPRDASCYPLSALDFKIESPYNTYLHAGFPPTPIGNPGISALVAAIHPKSSPYWYYLSDPVTHKTIFSRDLEEQEGNRVKYLGNKKR